MLGLFRGIPLAVATTVIITVTITMKTTTTTAIPLASVAEHCMEQMESVWYPDCHKATGFVYDKSTAPVEYDAFCHNGYCLFEAFTIVQLANNTGIDCSGNSGIDLTQMANYEKCNDEGQRWLHAKTSSPPPSEEPSPVETPTPSSSPSPPSEPPSSPQADGSSATEEEEGGGGGGGDAPEKADSSSVGSSASATSSLSASSTKDDPTGLLPGSASEPSTPMLSNSGGGGDEKSGGGMEASVAIGVVGGGIGALLIIFFVVSQYRSRHHHDLRSDAKTTGGGDTRSTNIHSSQDTSSPSAGPSHEQFIEMLGTPPAILGERSSLDHSSDKKAVDALYNSDALLAVRIPLEKITFGRFLSRGGFGEVYLGTYRNQPVAIKKLLPEICRDRQQISDLLLEATRMASLQHERVVHFIGVAWNSLSELCVVSEYMSRGDLRTLLNSFDSKTRGRPHGFDDMDKIRIALHVIHGLAFLHSLQPEILHRDLKSRNVLLDDQLNAKLTDFGVARERTDGTMTACVGTSLWMAPEVLMGSRYDAKADVFSFGVLLSELDQHVLPYAHAVEPDSNRKLPDTVILHRVTMGLLRVAFTGDNPDGEGDASLGDSAMAQLGRECVTIDPLNRPDTTEVLHRVKTEWRKRIADEKEGI